MMVFHAIGMNYRHDGEFSIDRPAGSGDELLLVFKTEARVSLQGGEVTAPPDSALCIWRGIRSDTVQTVKNISIILFIWTAGKRRGFLQVRAFPQMRCSPSGCVGGGRAYAADKQGGDVRFAL